MLRPLRSDFAQFGRGLLMGSADIIPGVSGGTIALIVGIYPRLVTAISRFDAHLVALIARREWRAAAAQVDLRFLVTLGLGILTGIVCLASLMLYLLTNQRQYTLAVFFGLILASSVIVARMVQPRTKSQAVASILLALVAGLFAFWLVGLPQVGLRDNLAYFFGCGVVAICAMILPGISGAYILWLLGAYETVTGIIHNAAHLQFTSREVLTLAVFATGCAVGLISFSKLLRWLLARAHMATMAVLGGFMVGSLRLMWPFQIDQTPDVEKLNLKQYQPFIPEQWNTEVTACLILAVAAMVAILLLERWGSLAQPSDNTPALGEENA